MASFVTKDAAGNLLRVPAIASFTGVGNQMIETNSLGLVDLSFLDLGVDDLNDADTSSTAPDVGDILRWDGINWVPSKDKLSWVWTVYDNNVNNNAFQPGRRFSEVLSNNNPFSPPVDCELIFGVSSCTDNDDFNIRIFINAAQIIELTHPTSQDLVKYNLGINLLETDTLYVTFQRIGGGNATDVTFELYCREL